MSKLILLINCDLDTYQFPCLRLPIHQMTAGYRRVPLGFTFNPMQFAQKKKKCLTFFSVNDIFQQDVFINITLQNKSTLRILYKHKPAGSFHINIKFWTEKLRNEFFSYTQKFVFLLHLNFSLSVCTTKQNTLSSKHLYGILCPSPVLETIMYMVFVCLKSKEHLCNQCIRLLLFIQLYNYTIIPVYTIGSLTRQQNTKQINQQ